MRGDPEEFRRRLEQDPADLGAFEGLEATYLEGGYFAEVAELYEYRAVYGVEGAESAELLTRASQVWSEEVGDIARSEDALRRSLEYDPLNREAVDLLDASLRERGDTAALMQFFEQQIEALEAYDPGAGTAALRAHYHQQLGEIWAQIYERQDQAVFYFRRAFELDATNVMALYCAREIYQQLGNHETAAKLLDLEARAEADGERRVALYRELAHARAERLGDLEGAVVALKRALALDPANVDVMGELALLLLRRAPLGGGDADRMRAAELLYQVALQASGDAVLGYCEAALDAWPEHEGTIALFEDVCRDSGRLDLLADRYRRLIEPLAESPLIADIYRRAGNLAMELGELDEAIGFYEGLAPLNDPSDHQVLTDLYRRAGRGDDLANALSSELSPQEFGDDGGFYDPEALPRLRELAELLRAQGRDEEAEARMLEILEMEPGDPEATSYLERRYRSRNDWPALYQLILTAGQSQKLSAAARVVRLREAAGIAEERLKDFDGAVAAYKLATVLEPDDPDLPKQLERLLIAGERWDELIDRVEAEAARAETSDEKIKQLRRIAEIHWGRRQDFESAADTFRRILELRPNDPGALEALDEIFLRESRWEELAGILERRESVAAPGRERASIDMRLAAVLHEHLEDSESAYEVCQRALESVPDRAEALRRMEAIDTISGNWERLLETLEYRADISEGQEAIDYLARAATTAESHTEDYERAARLWQQVTELDPKNIEAHSAKARCLESLGRWEDALECLEDIAEVAEELELRVEVRKNIARVLEERSTREEAIQAWNEVLEEADDAEALRALAVHYEAVQETELLVEILRRLAGVVETKEELAQVLLSEARVQAGPLDAPGEAIEVLERILADVDAENRDAMRHLRRLFVARGDFKRAAEIAEREVDVTEELSAKTELLLTCAAWYRVELQDAERAILCNERVLELDPYRADVIAALEELYVATEDWERLLQLTRARFKASTDDEQRRQLLIAGAEICEEQLSDGERAWGWYRELFDAYWDNGEVFKVVEAAAQRHGLARELVGVYGEMAKRAQTDLEQADWWKKLGLLYSDELEDPPRALEAMLRGFALDPDDRSLLDKIDEYALLAGAHDRLSTVYHALVDREPSVEGKIELYQRAATVLLGTGGNPALAFDQIYRAMELAPTDDDLLLQLESAADAAERWETLLEIYESRSRNAQDEGEKIDLLLRAAQVIQEHLDSPERAFELVIQAVDIDPDDEHVATRTMQIVDGLERLSGIRTRGRYWGQLIAYYQRLVDAKEEEPEELIIYLEWIARIQQDYIQDGRAAFETRKQQTLSFPGHKPTLAALERLAHRLGMWSDLVQHYKDALEVVLDRDAAIELHRRRSRVLTEELDRPAEAIEHYWQLIQINPHDGATRSKLTQIYETTERWTDLMLLLEKEIPFADEDRQREIFLRVASIWEVELGNNYEALDAYRRVLARWPGDPTAVEALERLKSPGRQSKGVGDEELAELGLLDDAEPPVFDDDEPITDGDVLDADELGVEELDVEALDADDLVEEELDAGDLIEEEELDAEDLIEEELDAGDLIEEEEFGASDLLSGGSPAEDRQKPSLPTADSAELRPESELTTLPPEANDVDEERTDRAESSAPVFTANEAPAPAHDLESAFSSPAPQVAEQASELEPLGSDLSSSPAPMSIDTDEVVDSQPLGSDLSSSPAPMSIDTDEVVDSQPLGSDLSSSPAPMSIDTDELAELTERGTSSESGSSETASSRPSEPPARGEPAGDSSRPERPSGGLFIRRAPSAPSPLVTAVEGALQDSVDIDVLDDDIEEVFEDEVVEVIEEEIVQELDSLDFELEPATGADRQPSPPPLPVSPPERKTSKPPPLPGKK